MKPLPPIIWARVKHSIAVATAGAPLTRSQTEQEEQERNTDSVVEPALVAEILPDGGRGPWVGHDRLPQARVSEQNQASVNSVIVRRLSDSTRWIIA